jgi:hypothetical protein
VLQRTGTGQQVTVLVNDGGTIRCNGGTSKKISDPLLIQARDLADDLAKDAKAKLHLPSRPNSVYSYRIRLPDGTIYFPDTAADTHHELAEAELFTVHTLQGPCRGG